MVVVVVAVGAAAVAAVGTSATAVAAVVATIVWSRRRPQCACGGGAGRHARARRCTTPSWRLLEMGSRRRGRYYCGWKGCVLAAVMLERSRFTQRSVPRMFAESTFRYGRRVNIRGSGMAKLESIFVPSPSSQCRPPATPALTRPKAPSPAHPKAPSSSSTLSSSSPPSRPCLLPASLLTPLSYVIPPSLRPSSVLPPPSSLRPPPYALLRPPCSLLALLLHGATSPTPSILRAAPGRRGSVRITSRSVGRSADRVWLEHSVSRKGSKLLSATYKSKPKKN